MSHRTLAARVAAALLAAATLAATPAPGPLGAQSPVSFDAGIYGALTRFDRSLFLEDRLGVGARIGMGFDAAGRPLRLEAELARTGSERNGAGIVYAPARLRLVYPMPLGAGRATLLLGAGGVRSSYSGGAASVVDYGLSGLAAVQVRLAERLALRIDGSMDYIGAPTNEAANMPSNWNSTLAVGVSVPLGRAHPVPRPEAPRPEPAPEPVVDSTPAPVAAPAPAPAPVDSDRDGVVDASDRCANTAAGARVDLAGCPVESDTDGDAVVDSRDRCPATPAGSVVDGTGCPPLFERETRTITLRGVTFQSGKAELTEGSLAVLDQVAAQLLDNPDVRIEVAGHTDASGARTANVRLSLARAEGVRAYLVSRGVEAERLVAKGYGPDEPVGSNATAEGRAMNRRVELRRID